MKAPKTLEEARVLAQAKANDSGRYVAIRIGDGTFRLRFATGTETDYILGEVVEPEWEKVKW